MLKRKPKIVDFSSNPDELNAGKYDEYGKLHFDLNLDNDKFVSLSPVKSNQSKLREYYNHNLWCQMHDFRKDGETKIKNIRRKYRNLLSPEVRIKKEAIPGLNIKDISTEPPIIFAKRDYSEKYRYDQLKEINSLKDRLARDGIP